MEGALATAPAAPDDGLQLTEDQTATLAILKSIRDKASGARLQQHAGR